MNESRRTSNSKLPQEVSYLLLYYRQKKPSHLYHFLQFPPQTRQEKEKLRLHRRYLLDVEKSHPETFNLLQKESIDFFLETPLDSFQFLKPEYLIETISEIEMSNQRSKAAKSSLGFYENDDDDDSFDGTYTETTPPRSSGKQKLVSPTLKGKTKFANSAGTICVFLILFDFIKSRHHSSFL